MEIRYIVLWLLFTISYFFTLSVQAQDRTVSGIVKDLKTGKSIAGVSVQSKLKRSTVSTDDNGGFTLSSAHNDTLEFKFVGYTSKLEPVNDRQVIEVQLSEDESSIEEVTVVAFGTQKKSSIVGAITTVNTKDLQVPSSNLTSAFAGRIPGMIAFSPSGEPGADNAEFFIRGVTTFGYQSSPLILIDGFESTTDNLARLQPDDIESFSVLKDASATVLYGARGANGIIMVTTKSGKEGPVKLSARVDYHIAAPVQQINMVDGVSYMKLYNEARTTRDPLIGTYYPEQKIQSTIAGENPMLYPNIDWYSYLFNKSVSNKKVNLNISGGGQVATYYVAFGADRESGLLKVDNKNNFNNNIDIGRYNIRTNVVFKLTPTTKLDTRIQARYEKYNGPFRSATDIFKMVMNINPVDFAPYYQPDAANLYAEHILFGNKYTETGLMPNPYAEMVRGYEDRNENNVIAQATLFQDLDFFTKGLKFQGKASATTWGRYAGRRSYEPYYYDIDKYNQVTGDYNLLLLNPTTGRPYLGDVIPGRNSNGHFYFEARLNWDRVFGNHTVSAMTVGMMEEKLLTAGNSTSIYETLPERNMGNSGRFSYNYNDRYFAEFAYGYNGSEKFTGNKRYGFFPSIGGGWMISNEKFWENINPVVNKLKLRATWGLVGNDAIAGRKDRFFYLSDISLGGAGYTWGSTFNNGYSGYVTNRYANPDITWEQSEKINLGFEAAFFNNALKIEGDFFKDNRSKIYMPRQNFPSTAGLEASISGNVGKVESQGFDGMVEFNKTFGQDFWLSLRGNFTYATNKYVELDEKDYSDTYLKRIGTNINQPRGLIAERLFVDQHEIDNSPKQDFGEYSAGDIKYMDVNGDGVVNANDMVPIGHPTVPEIQYGFGASMGYKAIDFSFFFQGNARTSFFIDASDKGIAPFVDHRNALSIIADDYWSETNPNVHAFWPRLSTSAMNNNTRNSTWWLRDGSFLRLKSVELGYSPKGLERFGVKKGSRIYFSAQNVFVLSSFKLWDPEMGSKGLGYPPNRRFNVGFQLIF